MAMETEFATFKVNDDTGSRVPLEALTEKQLCMLAKTMKEFERCRNFIRLYPTKATVERYKPILQSRESLSSSSACGYDNSAVHQWSATQLLATFLYGQAPAKSIAMAMEFTRKVCPLDFVDKCQSATPRELGDASRILGSKYCCRLVFMEYLIRLNMACRALNTHDRKKLAESPSSGRLLATKQSLLSAVRRLSKMEATDVERPDLAGLGGIVDELAASAACLLNVVMDDIWGGTFPEGSPPSLAATATFTSLIECLPPIVVRGAAWKHSVKSIQCLTGAQLEMILHSQRCKNEFGKVLPPHIADNLVAVLKAAQSESRPSLPMKQSSLTASAPALRTLGVECKQSSSYSESTGYPSPRLMTTRIESQDSGALADTTFKSVPKIVDIARKASGKNNDRSYNSRPYARSLSWVATSVVLGSTPGVVSATCDDPNSALRLPILSPHL